MLNVFLFLIEQTQQLLLLVHYPMLQDKAVLIFQYLSLLGLFTDFFLHTLITILYLTLKSCASNSLN